MPLTLILRQTALLKTKPDLASLKKNFGSAYTIGGAGAFGIFTNEVAPDAAGGKTTYLLYGNTASYGRGFYLRVDKDFSTFEIESLLPTTTHDLEDLFTFVGMLAKMLDVKTIESLDGQSVPRAGLTALFSQVREQNCNMLKQWATTKPGFWLSCVRLPLHIPESLCARMKAVPAENSEKYLSAYLAEKQSTGEIYLKPSFRLDADGSAVAYYELVEGTPYLIPKAPYIPLELDPFEGRGIDKAVLSFKPLRADAIGHLPYPTFIDRMDPAALFSFDDELYRIRPLSLGKMQRLLAGDE